MSKRNWEEKDPPLLKKIYGKFRHRLVLQTILHLLNTIGITIKPYYWVLEGTDPGEVPEIKGIVSEYNVEFLQTGDIRELGTNPWGTPVDKLISDLQAGNKCIALVHNNEIASSMWIYLMECGFKPEKARLGKNEAYLSSMYTPESFRGKNLAPYLRYKSYEFLKQIGREKIYSVTEYFNPAAARYKEKLKARNLRLILYLELFGKFRKSITLKTF